MKKKINYIDILKNRETIKVPEHIDEKACKTIQSAADQPPQKFFTLFYRPAFVYAIIALFLIVPSSLIVITSWGINKSPPVYTARNSVSDKENLLLEYIGDSSSLVGKNLYKKDVSQVDVRITSKGVILKWKNPNDIGLKEVVIEKGKKMGVETKTLFPGNVNFYIDPEYNSGDYYRIRCINERNIPSRGVYVIPEAGE